MTECAMNTGSLCELDKFHVKGRHALIELTYKTLPRSGEPPPLPLKGDAESKGHHGKRERRWVTFEGVEEMQTSMASLSWSYQSSRELVNQSRKSPSSDNDRCSQSVDQISNRLG